MGLPCEISTLPPRDPRGHRKRVGGVGQFPLCSASQVPWLPPQIFMPGKQKHGEPALACVYQPATTKGDDALSHWCNLNLHSRARHLKGAERRRGPSLEKGQLCPWAVLSSPHLSVKNLGGMTSLCASLSDTRVFLHTPPENLPTARPGRMDEALSVV